MRIQTFDFSIDLMQALLWQDNEAVRLQTLLQKKQDWYNVNYTQFWTDWYNNVFNLQTANDFGLAVWAVILNLPLTINPSIDPTDKPIFGFSPHYFNFNNGCFTSKDSNGRLTTEEKRLILRLRYFQLVSRGASLDPVLGTNSFLKLVFSALGAVYVLDGLDMTISCVFDFLPSTKLRYLLKKYDLIPRPSGVDIRYVNGSRRFFGFGNYHTNFDNGCFVGDF